MADEKKPEYNPTAFYHQDGGDPRVIRSKADADALGAGWFDSPKKAAAAKKAADEKAAKKAADDAAKKAADEKKG